jgi:hypothetical protein
MGWHEWVNPLNNRLGYLIGLAQNRVSPLSDQKTKFEWVLIFIFLFCIGANGFLDDGSTHLATGWANGFKPMPDTRHRPYSFMDGSNPYPYPNPLTWKTFAPAPFLLFFFFHQRRLSPSAHYHLMQRPRGAAAQQPRQPTSPCVQIPGGRPFWWRGEAAASPYTEWRRPQRGPASTSCGGKSPISRGWGDRPLAASWSLSGCLVPYWADPPFFFLFFLEERVSALIKNPKTQRSKYIVKEYKDSLNRKS